MFYFEQTGSNVNKDTIYDNFCCRKANIDDDSGDVVDSQPRSYEETRTEKIKLREMKEMHKQACVMLSIILLLSSCSFYSKSDYLADFTSFVAEIEENYESYSDDDWMYKDQEYEDFLGENYEQFSDELTQADKKQINKLKTRYQVVKVKHKTGSLIDEIGDGIHQLEKIIDRASDLIY